jgi:hypothetical protein
MGVKAQQYKLVSTIPPVQLLQVFPELIGAIATGELN